MLQKKYQFLLGLATLLALFMWIPEAQAATKPADMTKNLVVNVAKTSSSISAKVVAKSKTMKEEKMVVELTPNTYAVGQCTWGAKELAPWVGNNWGNANDWAVSAAAAGFKVGETPKLGAVMVWSDGAYGHVAVVTEVAADGMIQVEEANYAGNPAIGNYRGVFDPSTESSSAVVSYIYPPNTK
ncbi:CHAP domain-containing protein [Streptococcus sp. 20-1249]|uniref:CHAP domain-containing protein n=1 Tax=Streptococcus hepaticus TaxID=3349163 RepID=UPI00374A6269